VIDGVEWFSYNKPRWTFEICEEKILGYQERINHGDVPPEVVTG
jgi:hypothetical protein